MDVLAEAASEEGNTFLPGTSQGQAVHVDEPIKEGPQHSAEPSTATSDASTSSWHSAASTDLSDVAHGLKSSRSNTPVTSDEYDEAPTGFAHNTRDKNDKNDKDTGVAAIHRNASQTTITQTARPSSTPSELQARQSAVLSPHIESPPNQTQVQAHPSPVIHDTIPYASPPLPIPPHSRTPSRTKRRSVGSTISERMHHHEPPYLPDFLTLLSNPAIAPFTTPLERKLLDNLGLLGFDTGQIIHSVRHDACDTSGAIWWMLKLKAEQKEVETMELASVAPAKSNSATSLAASSYQQGTVQAERVVSRPESAIDAVQSLSVQPSEDEVATGPSLPPMQPQGLPSPPPASVSPEAEAVEYGGPSYAPSPKKSRVRSLTADRLASVSAPLLSPKARPAELFPTTEPSPKPREKVLDLAAIPSEPYLSPTRPTNDKKSTTETIGAKLQRKESTTKPRSSSVSTVSMLQRATSAFGASVMGKKEKTDEQAASAQSNSGENTPEAGGRSTPNLLASSFFGRKVSSSSATPERPELLMKRSKELLSSASPKTEDALLVPVPGTNSNEAASVGQDKGMDGFSRTTTSPQAPGAVATLDEPLDTGSMNLASASELDKSTRSQASLSSSVNSNAQRDSAALSSSPSGSTKSARSSKNLFSTFRLWFNDDKRKQRRHQRQASRTLAFDDNSVRASPHQRRPIVHAPSLLKRPPLARLPSTTASSTAPSRRNSSTSARHITLNDTTSPVIAHTRRRSDASRRSFGSISGARTPTSEREHSRPPSVQSVTRISSEAYSASRKRHARASSASSAGSRQSVLLSGSPVAAYRRTPSVTQVRRISAPSHSRGRSSTHHSRNPSNPSSVHTNDSRRSSMSAGVEGEETIIEEENENAEETVESERSRALRKLSGDLSAAFTDQLKLEGIQQQVLPEQSRPSISSRSSNESTRRRRSGYTSHTPTRQHSTHHHGALTQNHHHHHSNTIFAAHKVVNPFGTPNGSHYGPSAHHRPHRDSSRASVRDVFRNQKNEGDGEWIDEDEDFENYSGGFGQGSATTRSIFSSSPTAPAPQGLGLQTGSPAPPSSSSFAKSALLGEGRYAGATMARGDCAPPNLGRRPTVSTKGPSFKRAAIVEEEEEEDG